MGSTIETRTADGVVRGLRGRRVLRWRSIPYAAPPVGELRLRAPQPVEPWTGVRDATTFANAAIQPAFGSRTGPRGFQPMSEDCLTLNVVAPAESSPTPRPVMVFIHGGGYVFGTSAVDIYSGARLVTRGDIVYVSINYRLGAYGYVDFSEFSTDKRQFDVNLGLRDQVAALEWVRRNISAFGGDPDNVTIFGESAGGHAVTTLLATPSAAGLFHRAIAQSSPADWALEPDSAAEFARRCIANLGADPHDAAEALSNADPIRLHRAMGKAMRRAMAERPGWIPCAPVVDGAVLPKRPLDAIADGSAHPVPLIIGTNRNEGTLFAKFFDQLPTNPERIDRMFRNSDPAALVRMVAAYSGYPRPEAAIQLGGDGMFWRPTIAVCEGHSAHAATYNYRYDFVPRALSRLGLGATHGWELFAVFGYGDSALGRAITAPGGRRGMRSVTDAVQRHWLHFARYGRPLPSWPSYTVDTRRTLILDAASHVVSDVDRDRRLAWHGYAGVYAPDAGTEEAAS